MAVPLPRSRRQGRAGPGGLPSGHRWSKFAKAVVDRYGGLCHICGCGGAGQADHLQPWTEDPGQQWKLEDFRPAHGAPGNPCPVCSPKMGRPCYCNQLRGQGSTERARRIIAERIAANDGKPRTPARGQDPGRGREWLRL